MKQAAAIFLRVIAAATILLGLLASLGFCLDKKPSSAAFKLLCLAIGVYAPFTIAWLLSRWAYFFGPRRMPDELSLLLARILGAFSFCLTFFCLPPGGRSLIFAAALVFYWRRLRGARPQAPMPSKPAREADAAPLVTRLLRLAALILVEIPDAWLASRRRP